MLKVSPEYMVTEQDALAYVNGCLVAAICLVGGYTAAVMQIIPVWGLCIIVVLTFPRWTINLHELMHVYAADQINPFICAMGISPTPLSLLTLSYRELRSLHLSHHRAPATPDDPDAFHIRGPSWQVFCMAFVVPEWQTIRWFKTHGFSWKLGCDLIVKATVLVGLAWMGGSVFWAFWLSLRLVYGVADFTFFRIVHCQDGEYGTFSLDIPSWLQQVIRLVLGELVLSATIHHDIHHRNPWIAAHHLPAARRELC
ncbi:MAG: fatty acid desaturase [Cyanothece sp. SIO2G6]|nr:fatty acid desaturase [Cyanothece sp. SIO2G6]